MARRQISVEFPWLTQVIRVHVAGGGSEEDILNEWRESSKGRTIFLFVPDAPASKFLIPEIFSYVVSRLVTGHGLLSGKYHWMGLMDHGSCRWALKCQLSTYSCFVICMVI